MKGRIGGAAALALSAALAAAPAFASGGPAAWPVYVDSRGGSPDELARLYRGRLGVVMAAAPEAILYLDWRLLHGLRVGDEAGADLAMPCCDWREADRERSGVYAWLDARAMVADVPSSPPYLPTELPGPHYTRIENCFPEAFDTATATLRDRAGRYGASSPAVRAWLLTQDAVFYACGALDMPLPPLMAGAPPWLVADRSYQEAASALYNRRNGEAAARFAAIAHDPWSPWRKMGLYLKARALQREALARPGFWTFVPARAAHAALAESRPGTFGRDEARHMQRAIDYRDRPDALLAELDTELKQREPPAEIALALRDYLSLSERRKVRPEAADWIATMRPDWSPEQETARARARDHALERWRATGDVAWLVAAMTRTNPGDPGSAALVAAAERVKRGSPAWLTAQYHVVRLTIATAGAAAMRARLDGLLALPHLSRSERNLFAAARAQVASDLGDLARFALREPYCRIEGAFCQAGDWALIDGELAKSARTGGRVGLGYDSAAIIDRLPLDARIKLSRSAVFPAEIRLDLALTGFARAVQLRDDSAAGRLAGDLAGLLPQLRSDWRGVAAAPPGPKRRVASLFAMAKLPGLRADLVNYTRPRGTVAQFEGSWMNWLIVPRGTGVRPPDYPSPASYQWDYWESGADTDSDLACLGKCGGAFPLHLPRFVDALEDKAAAERAAFAPSNLEEPWPAGTVSLWEEALAHARANPRDPRSPELLYWLIRIARWGPNPDHLGRRAFQLLHRRYPGSSWAKRSPYYYG